MRKIKNIFEDTPKDQIEDEKKAFKALAPEGQKSPTAPELPDSYNKLDKMDLTKTLSRTGIYSTLTNFTPYLIKNLLYLSNSPTSSNRDQIQATKILLDKVIPNLESKHVQLETDTMQSLVIVKANTKKDPNKKPPDAELADK